MSDARIKEARDSLDRCTKDPRFMDRFYELFIDSSDLVAEKFSNTDFERQKKMLRDSLYLMLASAGTIKGIAHNELARIAKRHSRSDLNIEPHLYDLWEDCLMKAMYEFDPESSEALEQSWRYALRDGIEFLKSRYEK